MVRLGTVWGTVRERLRCYSAAWDSADGCPVFLAVDAVRMKEERMDRCRRSIAWYIHGIALDFPFVASLALLRTRKVVRQVAWGVR